MYHYCTYIFSLTAGKPFICPFEGCGRRFTGKSKLELHVRSHTDERPFICDKCGSGFRGNQELRAHRLTHTCKFARVIRKDFYQDTFFLTFLEPLTHNFECSKMKFH